MTPRQTTLRAAAALLAVALVVPACGRTSEPDGARVQGGGGTDGDKPRPTAAQSSEESSGEQAATDPTAPREPTGEPVTIALAGDVHFEGAIESRLASDPATTFGPIAETLSAADVAVVNLETAITEGGTPAPKEYTFRAPATAFEALQAAGVDVATLANNHGMDYGVEGLRDTLSLADAADFPIVGAGLDAEEAYSPWRTEVSGQRIAVFGATQVLDSFALDAWRAGPDKPGLASAKDEAVQMLLDAVRAEREQADTIVVHLHWGQERNQCPLDRQPELAQQLVEAGADVVVGSHAHVLLGGGYLAEGPGAGAYVDYGLGNFLFYARPGPGADTGVLQLTVQGRAVIDAEWVPAVISGGAPRPATGAQAERVVAEKEQLRQRCTDLAAEAPPVG